MPTLRLIQKDMPKLFQKRCLECPENLPTCCNMGSAYGATQEALQKIHLEGNSCVCEEKVSPQDIIYPLWCILRIRLPHPTTCIRSSVSEPALSAKQGERVLTLQEAWFSFGEIKHKHQNSLQQCKMQVVQGRAGKGYWGS